MCTPGILCTPFFFNSGRCPTKFNCIFYARVLSYIHSICMCMCNISMIFTPTNGRPMQGNRQVSWRISKSDDLPWGIRLLPQARGSARLGPRHRCVPSWVEPPIIMPLKVAGHWFFRAGLFVGYIHTYDIFMYTIYHHILSYIIIYIYHILSYISYIYSLCLKGAWIGL
jgi:hypothetical protein